MLVDVVELRRNGKPLPVEATQGAKRVRGMLQLDGSMHLRRYDPDKPPMIAQLIVPGTSQAALRGLLFAEVKGPLRNWQFLVIGREDMGNDKHPVRPGPRQTWWCTVVHQVNTTSIYAGVCA